MATALQLQKTKQVKFGLEVPSGLTYKGWEPGGEYTKPFILKNVNLKTQKIKYKISSDQFSSAVYPQPIVLSAGTSYTLPITFRPSAKCPYEEFILIETGEGQFEIPIQAQLPRADISLPQSLKFGMTAVQDSLTVNFELSNIGNVQADYSWKAPEGFNISPQSGFLPPKQSCKLTATFSPTSASVYSGEAVCSFSWPGLRDCVYEKEGKPLAGVGEKKVVKLEGVGKYPHVSVKLTTGTSKLPLTTTRKKGSKLKGSSSRKADSEKVSPLTEAPAQSVESGGVRSVREMMVDFGNVPVETVAEKWIEICNDSLVSLNFDLTPVSSTHPDFTPQFTGSEFEGSLQPHESKKIKLLFSPTLPTPYPSIGYFTVKAVGGLGSSTVVCRGTPVGPKVTIEERVVNFGNVELGKTVTRTLHVRNESTAATTFQFQLDSDSVFQLRPLTGELGSHSTKTLTLHFTPTKPIPHCRHTALLVKHQDPLFVSFIGTCYSETVRPVSIQSRHLDNYLQYAQTGLSKLPPEQLKSFLDEGQLSLNDEGALVPTSTDLSLPSPGTPLTPHTSTCAYYLQSQNEPSTLPHVSADVDVLSFGYCAPQRTSDGNLVSVTNHTAGTVTCVWMSGATGSFSVMPEERLIQPGATACFTVNFSPNTASQFYSKEIECFVFYKGLQDYHHIDLHTVIPPWCLTVRVSGHTFAPGTETFLPRLKIDNKNLVFPASVPGQPVHRTALLTNEGNTPILFDFRQDLTNVFSVKPSHGLIRDSQLLVLQLLPTESRVYKHILTCQLNATQHWDEDLLLSGSGEAPVIQLDNEGELFFKPTCVGASSSVTYSVNNTSRLPVNFSWKVDNTDECVVRVEPKAGTILPNQTQKHTWYFTPTKCQKYFLKAVLHSTIQTSVLGEYMAHQTRNKSVVNIHGMGTQGTIKFPSDMHLEPEYWAESGQMDDVEKHELNIVDNELFTVEPKRGSLQPGQVTTVIASFKHTHIGASKLPVLLKINRGREILLNWTGVTVEHGQASIHFTTHSHKFHPVPIGLQAYPRQVYTLCNVGESPVSYEVDTQPLEALTHNNYCMPVLECLQPKGLIPALSSVPVEFVFSPVEAKRYTVTLPIHLSTGDSVFVSVSGEGLDLDQPSPGWAERGGTPTQSIPVYGSISIHGQLAKLSQQTISFGRLPLFSAVRRLVFVSNNSPHTLSYQWDLSSELAKEVLSVQPLTGHIQPGESAACKITFCSHSSPSFYNLDLLCQVVNESEMLVYQSELRDWERREEEKKHLFTITDTRSPASKTIKRPNSMPKLKSLPGTQTKKTTVTKSTRPLSSENELRGKLSALPPIGVTGETYDEWKKKDLSVKSKTRPHAKESSESEPPVPPEPLTLHLGVSAHTLSVPDYSVLESDLDRFYIDQQAAVSGGSGGCEPVRVGTEEKQASENLLLQMIRELLDDADFHTAIKNVAEEPIPYFTQFSSRDELSESVKQSASRHIYASGLASMPSGHDLPPHPSHMHHTHTLSQCSLSQDADETHEEGTVTPLSRHDDSLEVDDEIVEPKSQERMDTGLDSKIKQCSEFTSLAEGILENTVLNILKEASSGEMNITAPIYTIAKAPDVNI